MTEIQDKIKAIGALDLTAGEKLIAITMALCKTSDTATLCELTGENRRAVQRARTAYLDLCDKSDRRDTCVALENDSRDKSDMGVATDATDATPVSPLAPASHARIETPSGLLYPEVKKEDSSLSEVPSDQCAKPKKVAKASRRFAYSDEFEAFWQAYPDRSNNSKPNAHREWLLLLPAERELAAQGLTHLAAHCRKNPDYRCVHAERYLKTRRWESYDMRPKVVPIRQPAPPPMSDEEVFRLANSRSWQ